MYFNQFGSSPLGFESVDDLSAAVGLTVPDGASFAVISPEGAGVRWRDDGDDPTSEVGMPILENVEFTYQGDLSAIKFIEMSASAKLNVSYYSATGGLIRP
jgi:hypothetical protein